MTTSKSKLRVFLHPPHARKNHHRNEPPFVPIAMDPSPNHINHQHNHTRNHATTTITHEIPENPNRFPNPDANPRPTLTTNRRIHPIITITHTIGKKWPKHPKKKNMLMSLLILPMGVHGWNNGGKNCWKSNSSSRNNNHNNKNNRMRRWRFGRRVPREGTHFQRPWQPRRRVGKC